jgi:hypothetical protein
VEIYLILKGLDRIFGLSIGGAAQKIHLNLRERGEGEGTNDAGVPSILLYSGLSFGASGHDAAGLRTRTWGD